MEYYHPRIWKHPSEKSASVSEGRDGGSCRLECIIEKLAYKCKTLGKDHSHKTSKGQI